MDKLLEWLAKAFGHIPVEGVEAMLFKGVQAMLVLLFFYGVQRVVLGAIERHYRQANNSNDDATETYKRVMAFIIWGVACLVVLSVMGLDLSSFVTASGLFAVAIGFGMKDVAANYFGGLIMKGNHSIKHGDVLEMDGKLVRVRHIRGRDTIVRSLDGLDILIPNSLLVQGQIANYTLTDSVCSVQTSIGVSYASDLKQVREVLEKAIDSMEGLSEKHGPVVTLEEFGNSSVNYEIFIFIDNPWDRRVRKSELNETLWFALKQAGIVIAFPQLDVHVAKN